MEALGGGGSSHFWLWLNSGGFHSQRRRKSERQRRQRASSGSSSEAAANASASPRFPLKQALTASSLALAGDTIAQLRNRLKNPKHADQSLLDSDDPPKDIGTLLADHDWIRALRMSSYGFLFYGPGSYAWYQFLDHHLPQPTVQNLLLKVLLNQIILGPCVIAVVFAWNNLWQGKLSELPKKYQNDALPTLLYGFRFWIPVSALNFWVVPLQTRVAFMSLGSIFWNYVLSSTVSK